MNLCGQFHGPVALFPGNSPVVPIQKGVGRGTGMDILRVLKTLLPQQEFNDFCNLFT